MEKRYFNFNEFCYPIMGKRKAAIYNLLNGEVFSLDENISKILGNSGASIEKKLEIAHSLGINEAKVFEFLEELVSAGLGRFSEKSLFQDKINLDFRKNMIKKGMIDLKKITVKVTNKCDLNCIFCNKNYSQLCFPCNRISASSSENWCEDSIKGILEDAALLNCDTVRFVGGDPFLEDLSFLKMLAHAADTIKNVEVFTNLSSLTASRKKTIAGYENVYLYYPFFGIKKKSFEAITRQGKFFEIVIKNALDLKQIGIKAAALIMRRKDEKMEDNIAFCRENGIDYKIFTPTHLTQNEEMSHLFDGFQVKADEFPETNYNDFFRNRNYNSCLGQSIAVDLDGNVKPCLYFSDYAYGNVSRKRLRNILREGKQDEHWNMVKDKVDGCKSCEYRYCCSSDCLVASKNIKGKIDAQYPFCGYDPYTGEWVSM